MAEIAEPIKTNLTAGEISPRLVGRVDISRYKNGARLVENFIPMPHGGAFARPGSMYVQPARTLTTSVRVIPFEFNEDQSYVLELSDSFIRFYANDGAVVEASKTITDISTASPGVVTSASHGYANGESVYINGVVGMTDVNGQYYTVAGVTTNTFTLLDVFGIAVNTSSFGAYVSGGTSDRVFQIASPYVAADLFSVQWAQSADVMYLVHSSYAPRKLSRTGHTSWTLSTPVFAATGVLFNTVNNYPSAVEFFEQRLWFANTNSETQAIWASVAGSFESFILGTNPDDALKYTISSRKVNPIYWLLGGKTLTAGTAGGIFSISADDQNGAITPSNVRIAPQSGVGTAPQLPVQINNSLLFVQRAKRKIISYEYKFEDDGFKSDNVTILSEHILRQGSVEMAYQQEEHSVLYDVRADGQIATLTYEKEQQVFAWARTVLGGTDAVVESITSIPDTKDDQIWMVVKRTINGQTVRYIEYFTRPFYEEEDATRVKADAIQVDSALTYNGTAISIVTNLDHLEGETVDVLADGDVKAPQVVTAGKITLPNSETAAKISVGLTYTPKIRLLRPEFGNPRGTSQGKLYRTTRVGVELFQTLGGYIGNGDEASTYMPIDYKDFKTMDQSPDLFTGYKEVLFNKGHTREPKIQIEQRDPLPMTVLAFMPEYKVKT